MAGEPVLTLTGVTRKYVQGDRELVILDNADFELR